MNRHKQIVKTTNVALIKYVFKTYPIKSAIDLKAQQIQSRREIDLTNALIENNAFYDLAVFPDFAFPHTCNIYKRPATESWEVDCRSQF